MRFRLTLIVPLITVSGFAQQIPDSIPEITPKNQLEEVTVTAFHINDSIKNLPSSVGIITRKQLLSNNGAEISSAINKIPGIYMQSGGLNTNRISIRGIGARTPFGTNKIRAFYGNIPLTSGDSETTIEDLDLQTLGQVEIIKGPQSAIYGSGLGGAIIISPSNSENGVSFSNIMGSYGLFKSTAGIGVNNKSSDFNISYHHLESDGWRENSAYNRSGITLSGILFKGKKSRLEFLGNYTYLKAYIPSSIDSATFENNPKAAAPTWKASKGFEQYDAYLSGLSYQLQFSKQLKFSTSIFLTHKEGNEPRPFDILLQNTTGFGTRTQLSGNFGKNKKAGFITGIEFFRDNFKARTFQNLYQQNNGNGSLRGLLLTEVQQNRSFYNAFTQIRIPMLKKLELQAGLNLNKTRFDLNNNFPESDMQEYTYETVWSPQMALLFHPGKTQSVYASVSNGFSLPSTEESLMADGSINPGIKPESGHQLEVGYKARSLDNRLHLEIALFTMRIRNLLIAERIGDDQYLGVNAGRTNHQGVELAVDYVFNFQGDFSISPYFSGTFGKYTFREFSYDGSDYSGNKLTGVSANSAATGMLVSTPWKIYFSASWRFTDKTALNDANTDYADAYALTDIKCGYQCSLNKDLELQAAIGVNNIFDTHYAAMILPNAVGFGSNLPRYYYPGMPVNCYGNLSFKYHF
jgi:iron complex outermembrane recepter protein